MQWKLKNPIGDRRFQRHAVKSGDVHGFMDIGYDARRGTRTPPEIYPASDVVDWRGRVIDADPELMIFGEAIRREPRPT